MIDGKLYLTVLTTKEDSGQNGIFVVEEYGDVFDNSMEVGKARKIAAFNLDKHDMEVVGLEALNNKILLLLFVDDIFTIKAFDTEGRLIDESSFYEINRSDYSPEYYAYGSDDTLNISLKQYAEGICCKIKMHNVAS